MLPSEMLKSVAISDLFSILCHIAVDRLTKMVNNTNPYLSLFPNISPPPSNPNGNRNIEGGPLWKLGRLVDAMLNHARNEDRFYFDHEGDPNYSYLLDEFIRFDTERSRQDYQDLIDDGFDVWASFRQLEDVTGGARFEKSIWCSPDKRIDGPTALEMLPCDSYQFGGHFVDPITGFKSKRELFLKFAESLDGKLVLYVSFHQAISRSY